MTNVRDSLIERLSRGEWDAVEDVYRTFEPVLRVMVRRRLTPRLRAKFDSTDVVQSAWADVLKGFRDERWQLSDREHLRAYLAKVTYNHLINHCRKHSLAFQYEQPLVGDEQPGLRPMPQPRPSELAQADELWQLLVDLCPPAHRNLLDLKRRGFPLAEIATRTGLHESSVRRILYDLARRLAAVRGEISAASRA
jgi:RNA polymerase sigma factor (sigma-70 family)